MLQLGVEPNDSRGAADEEEHGDAVEEALDGDGGERGGLTYTVASLQDPGPHQLARAQGKHIVSGVADDHDWEDFPGGDVMHRAQQDMPAVGADGDPSVEKEQGQRQEPPIDPRERVTDFVGMLTTEREEEEEEADRDTDPDARRPQRRRARGAVRDYCRSRAIAPATRAPGLMPTAREAARRAGAGVYAGALKSGERSRFATLAPRHWSSRAP
jgi:hypothetical protein